MKIAVLVKEVPDTWGDRRIDPATKRVDRSGEVVIDEINEKAVEAALLVKEANSGSEVTVVTMGPANAQDAIRKSLAMGADNGIHVIDDDLAGSDALQTSAALAAAIRPRHVGLGPRLVDEDQPPGIDAGLVFLPPGPPTSDVRAILFAGEHGFF